MGWGRRIIREIAWPMAVAAAIVAGTAALRAGSEPKVDLEALRAQYRRPTMLPVPADNLLTQQKIALGAMLFTEQRLSANDTKSCASCHDPALSFGDGVPIGDGVFGRKPDRHTPHLWNLAWAKTLFWDGRAGSLEEQARGPIESEKEMGQALVDGLAKILADAKYATAFAAAFPEDQKISEANALAALASYERTLVSPPTRFDHWVEGDSAALTEAEVEGFKIFNGKAGCSSCHSGWSFTDHAFHDIGLPGSDLGRGPIITLPGVDHAFKTPSLRELNWTAPYMHDGSLASVEDVLTYYESGGEKRRTRSPDMPNTIGLTDDERQNLLAFLNTLSSDRPPRPSARLLASTAARPEEAAPAIATSQVSQKNKLFSPLSIAIAKGETLTVVNDDTRPHNVRIFDKRLKFDSGLQEPGERARISLPDSGSFEAFCGIHPNMRLVIEVR